MDLVVLTTRFVWYVHCKMRSRRLRWGFGARATSGQCYEGLSSWKCVAADYVGALGLEPPLGNAAGGWVPDNENEHFLVVQITETQKLTS